MQLLSQQKQTIPDLSYNFDKFYSEMLAEGFKFAIKNSQFLILKCYKLAIDLNTIWINIGRILMTIIIIMSFILLIVFCFYDNKRISYYIK